MNGISEVSTYPVTPQDRMNYLLGLYSAVQQIGMVLHFPSRLDLDLLTLAIKLSIKKNPVLGCRFVDDDLPRWEALPSDAAKSILTVSIVSEEESTALIQSYLAQPMAWRDGPMVEARLFRTDKDCLCLKISHLCSDGTGVKEYTQILASLYTRLLQGESYEAIEQDLLKSDGGFRDQAPLFTAAGISEPASFEPQSSGGSASLWSFPSKGEGNQGPAIAIRTLGGDGMTKLLRRIKANSATVNDGLLAAYFRALGKQAVYMEPRTIEKAIGITVDLRRYLPNQTTGAVCNLSAMEMPVIAFDPNDTFDMTLSKASQAMRLIKDNRPGLSSAVGMERLAALSLSSAKEMMGKQHDMAAQMGMALPLLTNFGFIAKTLIRFGETEAEAGYMTSPIMLSPFFSLGASTYCHTLTLCVGYHTPAVSEQDVNRLLDDMISELTDYCFR